MYNDELKEVYSFYRQGEAFIVKEGDATNFQMDRMTDRVLGTMFLMYNKIIVTGTSDSTSFFKLKYDKVLERRVWDNYKTIDVSGSAYYTKGNVRIQIV